TMNQVFEANRSALLPILRLAARINTVHGPLSAMSTELDSVRAMRNASRTAADVWRDVYLPEDVITRILASLQLFAENDPAAPSGMLLEGPPGTGKTEIGRRIAKSGGVNFIMTSLADLKAGNVGGSE